MPSSSAKQHRFMEAVKHDSSFASRVGVPQKVGADFTAADKAQGKYQGRNTLMTNSIARKTVSG